MELRALNLAEPADIELFAQVLDAYSRTPGGGGMSLTEETRVGLLAGLPRYGNAIAFLSLHQGQPAGAVVGFHHLYVFSARPCANIQFIFVRPELQRLGIATALMHAFEKEARELGCCKLTLEVRETNEGAQVLYRGLGYRRATFGPKGDALEFWERKLT